MSRPVLAAAASSLVALSLSAQGQPATGKPVATGAEPVAACERAARQSLAAQAVSPTEVKFNAPPAVQSSLSSESQLVLRGSGRWRGAGGVHTFDYSCNIDPRNSDTVGLVMRDSTPAAAEDAAVRTPREPDLSHFSPAACETSAVEVLKQRWPRASQINLDSATRILVQDSPGRAKLHGNLRALPEPGLPLTHFGFDCEFDPRDGRVLSTRVSG